MPTPETIPMAATSKKNPTPTLTRTPRTDRNTQGDCWSRAAAGRGRVAHGHHAYRVHQSFRSLVGVPPPYTGVAVWVADGIATRGRVHRFVHGTARERADRV